MMPARAPDRSLLLSIHDVGPRFESEVDQLRDQLGKFATPDRIALLVVPNHWGQAPLRPGTPFAARLRQWAGLGAEVFVHGWFHQDNSAHASRAARFKAKHMTASEGEFLGLARDEAGRRMTEGRSLIEDITGSSVAGFIAPAWLYGEGALAALADSGFALAEDHWKIWQPVTGQVLARSPVLTWASRSRGRIASSLLAARALPPLLKAMRVARIGVHPGDTGVPALIDSIDRAICQLGRSHRAARYADLI